MSRPTTATSTERVCSRSFLLVFTERMCPSIHWHYFFRLSLKVSYEHKVFNLCNRLEWVVIYFYCTKTKRAHAKKEIKSSHCFFLCKKVQSSPLDFDSIFASLRLLPSDKEVRNSTVIFIAFFFLCFRLIHYLTSTIQYDEKNKNEQMKWMTQSQSDQKREKIPFTSPPSSSHSICCRSLVRIHSIFECT